MVMFVPPDPMFKVADRWFKPGNEMHTPITAIWNDTQSG